MKKKILKAVAIIAIIISTICIASLSFADNPKDPIGVTIDNVTEFNKTGGTIIGAIRTVGTLISVGVLIVLGVKYMMGSAEQKAEYKKTMIPYIVGAVLIFAAVNIVMMIYNFSNTINGDSTETSSYSKSGAGQAITQTE